METSALGASARANSRSHSSDKLDDPDVVAPRGAVTPAGAAEVRVGGGPPAALAVRDPHRCRCRVSLSSPPGRGP